MTVKEFLNREPSKKEVADMLCKMSNHELFGPPWGLFCWKELANYAGLNENDFWEDANALSPVDYLYGQVAWRYKDGKNVKTDERKFQQLAEEARRLYEKDLDNM